MSDGAVGVLCITTIIVLIWGSLAVSIGLSTARSEARYDRCLERHSVVECKELKP